MKKTTLNWLCFVIFVFAGLANADVVVLNETGREWVKVSDLPQGLAQVQKLLDEDRAKMGCEQFVRGGAVSADGDRASVFGGGEA